MPFELKTRDPASMRNHVERSGGAPSLQLKRELASRGLEAALQLLAPEGAGPTQTDPRTVAAAGTRSGGGALPHLDRIQAAFGPHDVTGVDAHVGGAVRGASEALGARAFATGNDVAFRDAPDLHTAAHEAAHIVQQRSASGPGPGLGARGDAHERHADAVADAVVSGQSAVPLLDTYGAGSATTGTAAVQRYQETKDFTGEAKEDEELFTQHAVTPTVKDDSLEGLEYKVSHDAPESMIVSDDGKLAIQKASQPQEFFAAPGLVESFNQQLAGNGTAVRLAEQGGSVTVKGARLVQVKAMLDDKLLTSFIDNECISVANIVLGKAYTDKDFQAIFEGEKHGKRGSDYTSKDVNKVANYLLDEGSSTKNPEKGIKSHKDKFVGKAYGQALGAGALDHRAPSTRSP